MKRISRRRFMTVSSMGVAGAYLSLHSPLAEAMMQRMGGGGVIDPPVGDTFKDPEFAQNLGTSEEPVFNLEAGISMVNVNGRTANLMTYNGFYPGPTIRVRKGDRVHIKLTNSLPYSDERNLIGHQRNITNLHTHGWHVSPEGFADNVMYDLYSGQVRPHVYDTSLLEPGTLNLYHPHKHGVSAEQYWAGLMGTLVVEDPADLLSPFETHIMVLKDISLTGTPVAEPAPHAAMMDYMQGKEGEIVMINGQVNPRLYLKKGQVQRWRIVNASNARIYRLSLENHTLQLIGTDGGLLEAPHPLSEIILSPGERVDILVKGTRSSGNHRLRSLSYSRMGMMGGGETRTLLTVTYDGAMTPAQRIPATINPDARRLVPGSPDVPIAARRNLVLSMGQGNGYINGQDFDVEPYMLMSRLGSYEIWTIINESGMDHPFHQHVNAVQILRITGGDTGYTSLYTAAPAWKDVVLVPKRGSVEILVPIMDWPGMTMFHCHILEHEDIGMMGMWHIMEEGEPM